MRYRSVIAVEARQLPPLTPGWHEFGPLSLEEIAAWCGGLKVTNVAGDYIAVPRFDGDARAWPGDWIVKDVRGQFHKVPRGLFEKSHHPPGGESPAVKARAMISGFNDAVDAYFNDGRGSPEWLTWAWVLHGQVLALLAELESQ